MDDLISGLLKLLWKALVNLFLWVIWEVIFQLIGWYVGWPVCRVLTLGSLPRQSINQRKRLRSHGGDLSDSTVCLVGLVASCGAAILIIYMVGSG